MSLRNTLAQSIAALERLTSLDPPLAPDIDQENEKFVDPRFASSHTTSHLRDEEGLIRRRASEPCLRHNSEKAPSLHRSIMSSSRDEDDFEPKLTLVYVAKVTLNFLTVALAFIIPAIGVCIIGLAADNINWATGRGSEHSNTVDAVILGQYFESNNTVERWNTRMNYMPMYYDTQTFAALIVAGVVCTLGGIVVGPLSVLHWRSIGRSVKLGAKKNTSQFMLLFACVILDLFMFIVAVVVIIYARELFTTYNYYDSGWDHYRLQAKYFYPPLPSPQPDDVFSLVDDVIRYYWSPLHYNPLNWNCRFQGHVSSSMQHRIFELCEEGVAARNLLAVLVALQGLVLTSHLWAFWTERKRGGRMPWIGQRLGSQEQIVPASGEGERTD